MDISKFIQSRRLPVRLPGVALARELCNWCDGHEDTDQIVARVVNDEDLCNCPIPCDVSWCMKAD